MATYRLFLMVADGHVQRDIELECDDPDGARKLAEEHRGPAMELWSLGGQVEVYSAKTVNPHAP